MSSHVSQQELETRLLDSFGSFKMEWTDVPIGRLFTEPSYFHDLSTARPCVIEGGRGTGKTTTLTALRTSANRLSTSNIPTDFSVYFKIPPHFPNNFSGPDRDERAWVDLFLRHFQTQIALLVTNLAQDLIQHNIVNESFKNRQCKKFIYAIDKSINTKPYATLSEFHEQLLLAHDHLDLALNNVDDTRSPPQKTRWEQPLTYLFQGIVQPLGFSRLTVLLDEYENLLAYQQKAINTLIKFSSTSISYKVGMKTEGWKTRATYIEGEYLRTPADYTVVRTEATSKQIFSDFAHRVIKRRLSVVNPGADINPTQLFESLSVTEESQRLSRCGLLSSAAEKVRQTARQCDSQTSSWILKLDDIDLYIIERFAATRSVTISDIISSLLGAHEKTARQRIANYRLVALYSLGAKRRDIKKYYCGWTTLCQLAGGNIRFLMELVQETLLRHIRAGQTLLDPITPEIQTLSAIAVAERNLYELEGMTAHGRRLIRVVQSLGTLFSVLIRDGFRHAPDVNQFRISDEQLPDERSSKEYDELLRQAIMHLAILRHLKTKRTALSEIKSHDYSIHPIYTPFFGIPYQKKRKLTLNKSEFLHMSKEPSSAIEGILSRNSFNTEGETTSIQITMDI